jgi:hypothetical protein
MPAALATTSANAVVAIVNDIYYHLRITGVLTLTPRRDAFQQPPFKQRLSHAKYLLPETLVIRAQMDQPGLHRLFVDAVHYRPTAHFWP